MWEIALSGVAGDSISPMKRWSYAAAKRAMLSLQIRGLLSKPKVPRKDLEACIGLLMWATNISPVLRPYLAPLYRLLNSPPGANYSIAPRMWPLLLHCLDSRAVLVREATGLSLPLHSRVIEWGNKPIVDPICLSCLSLQATSGFAHRIRRAQSSK